MIGFVNTYELNIKGDYEEPTDSGTTEEVLTWAQKTGAQYASMAMSKMNRNRDSEGYEAQQLVGSEEATFKVMKFNRVFSATGRINISGDYWYLKNSGRLFKGNANILLLDAVKKDN